MRGFQLFCGSVVILTFVGIIIIQDIGLGAVAARIDVVGKSFRRVIKKCIWFEGKIRGEGFSGFNSLCESGDDGFLTVLSRDP